MNKKQIILVVILILAIAGFFRLWQLDSIPPGLYPDEAMNGNNAVEAIKTGQYKLFYPENNGREGFFINLQALSLKIFGINILFLKLISALIGILTVLGLYFLTLELFKSQNIALLASFFLATSFWHINFSRIGFRAIMVPFCLVWSFYFLFKVINVKNKNTLKCAVFSLLAGAFFGLGFHTYIAFRMAVIILIIPIILICINFWKEYKNSGHLWTTYFKKGFWQYALWIIAIIIVALPMGLYFLHNPQDFIGRAGGVSIFAQGNPIQEFVISIIKTLGMFNFVGDYNWRHNFSGSPQLLWPVGIFFIVGIITSIKKIINSLKEKNSSLFLVYSLLLVWFGAMLLPAILTYEGVPHALRTIGAIPVCYIFAALGAYVSYRFLYKFVRLNQLNKFLLFVTCCLLLIAIGYAQYDKYFIDWARQPDVKDAFAKNFVDIGNHLNNLPPETACYVIVNQSGTLVPVKQNGEIKNIPMPAQTIIFIEQMLVEVKFQPTKYLLPEEIDEIEAADKLVVIPLQYDQEIFRKLKQKFPQGEIKFQENFWLFEI